MQTIFRETGVAPLPLLQLPRATGHAFGSPSKILAPEVAYLVEPDFYAREEISAFLTALDISVVTFSSGHELLEFAATDAAACVVLNLRLPDISGLETQRRLAQTTNPPVIFISDPCDVASTVCAMKAGAVDFLTRPFSLHALVAPIQSAFIQDRKLRQRKAALARLQERLRLLTPREREVLPLIVGGLLNKQAASILGISEVTLQIHRGQVMRKMQAGSFAELVRMTIKLRLPYWQESRSDPGQRTRAERSFHGVPQ